MAIHKKKKPTTKELSNLITGLMIQVGQIKEHMFNSDRALDEYVKFKGDKKTFMKYLEDKYTEPTNDKDNKEIKDK